MQDHEEVARRAAAGAALALAGQAQARAGVDAGGDLDVDGALLRDPSLAGTVGARLGDDIAIALAVRARLRGADLAQDRALRHDHLTATVALGAGDRLPIVSPARPVAGGAHDVGVELDRLGHPEDRLRQRQPGTDQLILTAPDARLRPARRHTAPEHRTEQIADIEPLASERAESAETTHVGKRIATSRAHRIAPAVEDGPLVRVAQNFVCLVDLLEFLLGVRVGGHIRMHLHGHLAVGLLDLIGAGVPGDAEDRVVIRGAHRWFSFILLPGSGRRNGRRPARRR